MNSGGTLYSIRVEGIKCANTCVTCFGISHLDCYSCVNNLSLKAGTNECECPIIGSTLDVNDLKCKCDSTSKEPQDSLCPESDGLAWEITQEPTEKFKAELPSVPSPKKDDLTLYFRIDSTLNDEQKELFKTYDFKSNLNITKSESGDEISSDFKVSNFGKISILTLNGFKFNIDKGETLKIHAGFNNSTVTDKISLAKNPVNEKNKTMEVEGTKRSTRINIQDSTTATAIATSGVGILGGSALIFSFIWMNIAASFIKFF